MDIFLIILILGIIAASFQAWNIGANDVANAMGTSVGSKAVTLKQAIVIAAIFEFSGAVLVGSHVADTLRNGLIDTSFFDAQPQLLAIGMLSALLAAGIWLFIATIFGLPVSTTHAIVGSVVGIGIAAIGFHAVHWPKVIQIATSWVISPLLGGVMAYAIFTTLRKVIYRSARPIQAIKRVGPFLIFTLFFILSMSVLFKGLKNLKLDLSVYQALGLSSLIALMAAGIGGVLIARMKEEPVEKPNKFGTGELRSQFHSVERVFMKMQILTACSMAFAHGANDVANAIGPLAVIASLYQQSVGIAVKTAGIPMWIVLLGGVGIVIGLATYGYKVIQTIGNNITELTPMRGFSAELAAASTILVGSRMGLPISTTHTLVGAVIGIGLAQGVNGINRKVIINIVNSWLITVPFAAIVAIVIYFILSNVLL
jgi:inorganic phosphate transporter, PiT family